MEPVTNPTPIDPEDELAATLYAATPWHAWIPYHETAAATRDIWRAVARETMRQMEWARRYCREPQALSLAPAGWSLEQPTRNEEIR